MTSRTRRLALELLATVVLGIGNIVVPVALDPPARQYDAELLPVIRNAIEGMKAYSLALLLILVVVMGFVSRARPWQLGSAWL